jgi:hypothetical protein
MPYGIAMLPAMPRCLSPFPLKEGGCQLAVCLIPPATGFVLQVVFMDYHVELAGVTLTTAAIGMAKLGPAIRNMLSSDVNDTKE